MSICIAAISGFALFSATAFANEDPYAKTDSSSDLALAPNLTITVNSEEEFDEIANAIQARSAAAEELWEASASRESKSEFSLGRGTMSTQSVYQGVTIARYHFGWSIDMNLQLIYNYEIINGVYKFTSANSFFAYPSTGSTLNVYWQYRFLDSMRVCAVSTTYVVTIKNASNGKMENYSLSDYVEYNANGQYWVQ